MQAAIEAASGGRIECARSAVLTQRGAHVVAQNREGTHVVRPIGSGSIRRSTMAHVQGNRPPEFDEPLFEYLFLNNTACNLASLNLMKFKGADGELTSSVQSRGPHLYHAQEIIVDTRAIQSRRSRKNYTSSARSPRLFQSRFAHHELRHVTIAWRSRTLRGDHRNHDRRSLRAERTHGTGDGPFPGYRDARCSGVAKTGREKISRRPCAKWSSASRGCERDSRSRGIWLPEKRGRKSVGKRGGDGKRYGYRQCPGDGARADRTTISFLMDCDTTGIEPDIALVKYKTACRPRGM